MKLNDLLKNYTVSIKSFPAFKELENHCKKYSELIHLCTGPADILLDEGITEYYTPIIPRGSVFKTSKEIIDADLDVTKYRIKVLEELDADAETIIVSRHWAAIDKAHELYPDVKTILLGNVTKNDISCKNVVGVLPPQLIPFVSSYTALSIRDYNASEGDLSKEEIYDDPYWINVSFCDKDGVLEYYTPIIPAEIIIVANNWYTAETGYKRYPDAKKILLGNVTKNDISGKNVVGVLPPQLIPFVKSYTSLSVDYIKRPNATFYEEVIRTFPPFKLFDISDDDIIKEFLIFAIKIMAKYGEEKYEDLSKRHRIKIAKKFEELFPDAEFDCGDRWYYRTAYFDDECNTSKIVSISVRGNYNIYDEPYQMEITYMADSEYKNDYLSIDTCKKYLGL